MQTFEKELSKIENYANSQEIKEETENAQRVLKEKPFVIYSAGDKGKELYKLLKHFEIEPVAFCDKKADKEPILSINGIPVIKPSELMGKYADANILVPSTMFYYEIYNDLKALGVPTAHILSRKLIFLLMLKIYSEPLADGFVNDDTLNCYKKVYTMLNDTVKNGWGGSTYQALSETYNALADERSKQALMDYLGHFYIGTPVQNEPAPDQYLDEVINLTNKEVIADCGANAGDTAHSFIEKLNGSFKGYYAFEPLGENYIALSNFFEDKKNMWAIQKGVWSGSGTLSFNNGTTGRDAKIDLDGETCIDVVSLDDFFADKPDKPTFIKMDIEGAELEALKGAANIIKENKPKLAICIYHKPEDLYEIPAYIKSLRDDYKLYIRPYYDCLYELVLYAV